MNAPLRSTRLLAVLLLALVTLPLDAQYFGRNKMQWEDFAFQVLRTEHFDIYYYADAEPVVDDVARMAERWYVRLSKTFRHDLSGRKPIVLYANHPDFQQTTTTGGLIGQGTGGFTDFFRNRVVMPLTGTLAETDHVLGHELVHVFQFDLAASYAANGTKRVRLQNLPLWIVEGLAEYLSQGSVDTQTAMWMRDAVVHDRIPDIAKLNRDPRLSPYQYGQAFWAWITGKYGDGIIANLFVGSGIYGVENALEELLGKSIDVIIEEWRTDVTAALEPAKFRKAGVERLGDAILSEKTTGGELNIAPSLSPDGRWVAFLSTRDLFSVDLFLADALTGRVDRKLVSASADPHMDALRFIDSSGSWSPDSKEFAFVVFSHGDNSIAFVDIASKRIVRHIQIPGVGAISNPAWSPDGGSIAFSGAINGSTDLFIIDLETEAVRRLTKDRFGDLQPAWSPDGRKIAFVTERFGTELGNLDVAPTTIAIYDLDTDLIHLLRLFEGALHSSPQYSPDGTSLYFVANPTGIADVFRWDFESNRTTRLTAVDTGISGITDLSPALSVASRSGHVMFSVFRDAKWEIHKLDPDQLAGEETVDLEEAISAEAILSPADPEGLVGTVATYLEDPATGLPDEAGELTRSGYRPKLGLDFIGPPNIGVGVDRFGLGVGGSFTAYFSDVLGEHQIGVTLEGGTSSRIETLFGGQVFYLNRQHRMNWGSAITHIPFLSAFTTIRSEVREIDGQPLLVDVVQQVRETITIDELSAIAQYPFGQTRRFETSLGYSHLGFDAEVESLVLLGNTIVENTIEKIETVPDFGYTRSSVALVGDSSIFGFISPVRGRRYRLEVERSFGDIDFQSGLADFRQYWFRRPVTFALRAYHYGRYGTDAEDERLSLLYVGRETLVRGYDVSDISLSECVAPAGSRDCPVYDRLIGSRVGVVNLELRMPLFGPKGFGLVNLPSLPTEIGVFVDGGVAWTSQESPKLRFEKDSNERVPVFSAGLSARILLAGLLPLQFYYATPFQRPERDWVFGFTIAPGW